MPLDLRWHGSILGLRLIALRRESRMSTAVDIQGLREQISGQVLQPWSDGYDEARRVHNGAIDKRPAAIVEARATADVVAAVRFANEAGLEISVRGGGHNVAGRAVTDGGLMIDLSAMKGIQIDPVRKIAHAEPGLTWGEFNTATQAHGLATTGGLVSSTGISGFTLGGGLGWLMGRHGLAADNLLSAEIVTAACEVLRVSAGQNPDLFWALRGGGGNFGVVTSLEYRLHPIGPTVYGGVLAFPIEQASAVFGEYRRVAATASDELGIFCGLKFVPDGSGRQRFVVAFCHTGSQAAAEAEIRPLRTVARPELDAAGPGEYAAMNTMLDASFPRGALNYWKSTFLGVPTDEAFEILLQRFVDCPSEMSAIVMENLSGEVTRIAPDATAFPLRQAGANLLIVGEWLDPDASDQNISWVRSVYDAMTPYLGKWNYVNYMADDATQGSVANAYGSNYERLRAVKRRYDPNNVFHLNQNVVP
jgi:FAD/FMN-containing dehydrogenase